MESLRSFNLVLGLLADTASIESSSDKTINSFINKLAFRTNYGFQLSVYYNIEWCAVNATYIISQIRNLKREFINARIDLWRRTKEGVWAVDMLVNNTKDEHNEELVYKYKNHSLWKYNINWDNYSRIYFPEFVDVVIRDNIYNPITDLIDISKLKHIGTNGQFWIESRDKRTFGDVWCSLDFLYDYLFKLFDIEVDDTMINIKHWLDPKIQTEHFKNEFLKCNEINKDFQFYINDEGAIAYKLVERQPLIIKVVPSDKSTNYYYYAQTTNDYYNNNNNNTNKEKEYYPRWGEYLDDDTYFDPYSIFD